MTQNAISTEFELDNRRTAPRLNLNLKLTQNGRSSQTINLSATGVRFVTQHKVTPTMEFDLHVGSRKLRLRGETKWTQPMGSYSVVGAHFEQTNDLPKLREYLYSVAG